MDVFFVISGFLMTQIISGGLERGRFSVLGFYVARARRIVPALLSLCTALVALGWFFLPAPHYRLLANHVISAAGFFSNVKFWKEAGYFDPASHEKWLLHTWSLSVEWQFYLVLPLVLLLAHRILGRRGVAVATLGGLAISLLACIAVTPAKPTAAFFLLPFRAWEMFAGGAVALLARPGLRGAAAIERAGLALIAASAVLLDGSSQWPGWRAVFPITGTAMVLLAGRQGSMLTSAGPLQWLGDRSYSIYLWHWPLVVAIGYVGLQRNALMVAAGVAVTLALGDLSYRWIEAPTRRGLAGFQLWTGLAGVSAAVMVVAVPAVLISTSGGMKGRLSPVVDAMFTHEPVENGRTDQCLAENPAATKGCVVGSGRLGAIVIGDSHASRVVNAVHKAIDDPERYVLDWTLTSCPTLFGVKKAVPVSDCQGFLRAALKKQSALPQDAPLIIVNRLSYYAFGRNEPDSTGEPVPSMYFDKLPSEPTPEFLAQTRAALIETACTFAKSRPVYLVRPLPEMGRDVPHALWQAWLRGGELDVSISHEEYRRRQAFVWEAQDAARAECGVQILDPTPIMCPRGRCLGADGERPLYSDDDHLSARGADLLIPMFEQAFGRDRRGISANLRVSHPTQ